jgi:hypothetical protein
MDKQIDQSPDTQNTQAVNAPPAQAGASRRKFTRGALLGGAVVISLGNRAAWSQEAPACIMSATGAGALQASARAYLTRGGSVSPATLNEIERFQNLPAETQEICNDLGLGLKET